MRAKNNQANAKPLKGQGRQDTVQLGLRASWDAGRP